MNRSLHRLFRRWAKIFHFFTKGNGPRKAIWLANADAPIRFDYRHARLADLQAASRTEGAWADFEVDGTRLHSKSLDLDLSAEDIAVTNFTSLLQIRQSGVSLKRVDGFLHACVRGMEFRLCTAEEINIVHELFVDGCYDLHLFGEWNVIDIGANVGIASLLFAAQPWVSKIWSFEPFPGTYEACEVNLNLNPVLASKITLMRFGLAAKNETLQVEYRPDLKGSMTLEGLGPWRGDATPAKIKQTVNVEVRAASNTLSSILTDTSGRKTLAKIDCEGSEFAILDDLEAAGMLGRLDAIIMEWHGRDPSGLCRQLTDNGFDLNLRHFSPTHHFGLLVAWRRS